MAVAECLGLPQGRLRTFVEREEDGSIRLVEAPQTPPMRRKSNLVERGRLIACRAAWRARRSERGSRVIARPSRREPTGSRTARPHPVAHVAALSRAPHRLLNNARFVGSADLT
jgi:hypothetical protein